MPSNKTKVLSYLNEDEEKAFNKFRDENELTNSQAVNLLIKNSLIENDDSPESLVIQNDLGSRLERLEKHEEERAIRFACSVEKVERLEEWVCVLQSEVDQLKREAGKKAVVYLTDENVASYAGVRVATVKEWRLGLRKPRGAKICKRMEILELDLGRWRVKESV